ncbi:MAG: hypothetical protein MMC23_000851 [Stictis urceolatum]|nr:hypothetical protein [Stictis urceolata]
MYSTSAVLWNILESGFISVGDLRRQQSEGFGYSPKASKLLNTLSSISGGLYRRGVQPNELEMHKRTQASSKKGHTIDDHDNMGDNILEEPAAAHTPETDHTSDAAGNRIMQTQEWAVEYHNSAAPHILHDKPPHVERINWDLGDDRPERGGSRVATVVTSGLPEWHAK